MDIVEEESEWTERIQKHLYLFYFTNILVFNFHIFSAVLLEYEQPRSLGTISQLETEAISPTLCICQLLPSM